MPTPSSLLADAIHQLQLLALNPVRRPGRREIYDLADGTSCLIRTGPKGTAMTKAESPDAASLMPMLEGEKAPDFYVFATPAPRNNGPTEVYKIPMPCIVGDFRSNHAVFAETHPNATNLRALHFGGSPTSNGRGYRERYREFLLLPNLDDSEPGNRDNPAEVSPLELALRRTLHAASAEYGQPPDRIRISIGVMFRTGEVVFHWTPGPDQ